MKKFISVILAALMLVTVMPFAIFAADAYKEPANQAHVCHPVGADGKPVAVDVDMKALYDAEKITIAFDGAKDYNKPAYLVDGKADTATRLTKGDKTVITITSTEAIDFATLKVVVNGQGTINGGSGYADKVTVASNHDFKVAVVVYAKVDGKDVKVFEKEASAKDATELVFDVYEAGYKVVITTAGTKEDGVGGPRLWEIDATTVQGPETYVHTWVNTITKYPALGVEGEYTQKCAKCGYDNPEKQVIPALTKADLTGGYVTNDMVESIVETHTVYKADGKTPEVDDDGNVISYQKHSISNPNAIFDGVKTYTNCYDNSGNFWTGLPGSFLTVTFKEDITVSSITADIWTGWAAMKMEFYLNDKLVGTSEYWYWAGGTIDLSGTVKLGEDTVDVAAGFTFDKIVLSPVGTKYGNYQEYRLSELNLFTHTHVYDDSLIEALKPTRTENKTCEYAFADASKVVCRECGLAAGKANEKVTLTIHDYPETVVDGKVVLDQSKGSVTAATCGKDGKIEYTCSHKCDNTDKPVYTRAVTKDGYKVYGKNNTQKYVDDKTGAFVDFYDLPFIKDKDGKDTTERDMSSLRVEKDAQGNVKYETMSCGDKVVEVVPATGEHKATTTTVRLAKYPNCGTTADAYVVCTDCKQRVEIKTADDLKKFGFVEDAEKAKGTSFTKSMADEATGAAYKIEFTVDADGKVTSIKALTTGYHTLAYKNAVASTYTVAGIDVAYCTKCGTTFLENTKAAELAVPNAKVRFNGFTVRTAEFEGVRAAFTLNKEVIKIMQDKGFNVRIFAVVTNAAGVSKEVQVYGAGAKAPVDLDGRYYIVVKGAAADETLTFSYKVIVDDMNGSNENVVELASTSLNDVKAAK